jgi:hypothetical protein
VSDGRKGEQPDAVRQQNEDTKETEIIKNKQQDPESGTENKK